LFPVLCYFQPLLIFWKSSEPVPVFWKSPFIALLVPILESKSFEKYLLSGGLYLLLGDKAGQDFFPTRRR
jgi:hypothetical protein